MAAKKTGPLAKISLDDTCVLIDLIHGHDVLWDLRHPQYRISTMKNATWTAVRVVFQERTGIVCEDQHVIAKFEALRSSFSRELRKLKESKKSGAGAEDVRKVTWPFFNQMTFLRGSVSLDNYITSNMGESSQMSQLEDTMPDNSGLSSDDETEPELIATLDDSNGSTQRQRHPSGNSISPETSRQSTPSGNASQATSAFRSPGPSTSTTGNASLAMSAGYGRKVNKRALTPDPLAVSLARFVDSKQTKKEANEPRDELVIWSQNLCASMRGLNPKRKRRLRLNIDSLLHKAMVEEADSEDEKDN